MNQLPIVSYPYVSDVEFLKEVKNVNGKAKKKKFKENRVMAPFYFYLKIKEIENSGVMSIVFYENSGEVGKANKKVEERVFEYGQAGKYYEYIIFFDQVEKLGPGKYRYAVFCNRRLIYESQLTVNPSESKD